MQNKRIKQDDGVGTKRRRRNVERVNRAQNRRRNVRACKRLTQTTKQIVESTERTTDVSPPAWYSMWLFYRCRSRRRRRRCTTR